MQTALDFLKSKKFAFSVDFTGTLQRFDRNGKITSGWAVGKIYGHNGTATQCLRFGDWATGEEYEWWSKEPASQAEAAEMAKIVEADKKAYQAKKKASQIAAQTRVQELWSSLPTEGDPTPYSLKKGLYELYGTRSDGTGNLFVPLYATNGILWNLQKISADGTKRFFPGGRIKSCFFTIGEISPEGTIYVCEGYATGASIFEALTMVESEPGLEQSSQRTMDKSDTDRFTRDKRNPRGNHPDSAPGMGGVGFEEPRDVGEILRLHETRGLKTIETGDNRKSSSNGPMGESLATSTQERVDVRDPTRHPNDRGPGENTSTFSPQDDGGQELGSNTYENTSTSHSSNTASGSRGRNTLEWHRSVESGIEKRSILPPRLPKNAHEYAVAIAFNSGNLEAVCKAIKNRYPNSKIIVAGDDDIWTNSQNGTKINPGRESADHAARICGGISIYPRFDGLLGLNDLRPSDFNDMAVHLGPGAVKSCLFPPNTTQTATLLPPSTPPFPLRDTNLPPPPQNLACTPTALEPRFTNKGKPIPPTELEVVRHLLAFYGNRLIKQNSDLFLFVGTHWRHLQPKDLDLIKQQIQIVCNGEATYQKMVSLFHMFMAYVTPAAREMFTPLPWAANFTNGTLFAMKRGQDYHLEFKPHSKDDFIINVLPFEYAVDWEAKDWRDLNPELNIMFNRVFDDASDKDERIAAVSQIFGACLMPTFPHLNMLYGPPGTGKSTVIKIAARMVDEANLCDVEPHEFHGFNMESMAGKLVNIDTDIAINEPIADNIAKKIEDRRPVKIHRKGLKDIYAPLPCTHIFGGNEIPRTLEGVSRAHDRRWTFLEFTHVLTRGDYDKMYDEVCFAAGPEGVLNFALCGLKSLLVARGHFINPTSGKAKMQEWQLQSDPVGQFLEDIKTGEAVDQTTTLNVEKDGRIRRGDLWVCFKEWHKDSCGFYPRFAKNKFYHYLRVKGFGELKNNDNYYFVGLQVGVGSRVII